MECVNNPSNNCCPGGKCDDKNCPSSHHCCWQDPGNGSPATLGLCVKRDNNGGKKNCDYKRGIPQKSCKDPTNKYIAQNYYENFFVNSKEGYDSDDCDNWKKGFYILASVILIFVLFIGANMLKKSL